MENNLYGETEMTEQDLEKKQQEMQDKIRNTAEALGLSKDDPVLEPICDGVSDIEGYLKSNPKIMWILKEPWDDMTAEGIAAGGGWSLTELFKNNVWMNQDNWKLMIQINYAIRNNLTWEELDYIENNSAMADELKKMAYINISKMPNGKISSDSYLTTCYDLWKDILFEQIGLYSPDIIIFGNTFKLFAKDLGIDNEPTYTATSGKWCAKAYKKDKQIFIDAYHPSRKGGEDGGHDYVTSVIEAAVKSL